jgi:hypothetical protein
VSVGGWSLLCADVYCEPSILYVGVEKWCWVLCWVMCVDCWMENQRHQHHSLIRAERVFANV